MTEVSWNQLEEGSTLGLEGSEGGVIARDEEHPLGARITLEQDGRPAPFAITSGVYGWMVHTCFFATESEADSEYGRVKDALAGFARRGKWQRR